MTVKSIVASSIMQILKDLQLNKNEKLIKLQLIITTINERLNPETTYSHRTTSEEETKEEETKEERDNISTARLFGQLAVNNNVVVNQPSNTTENIILGSLSFIGNPDIFNQEVAQPYQDEEHHIKLTTYGQIISSKHIGMRIISLATNGESPAFRNKGTGLGNMHDVGHACPTGELEILFKENFLPFIISRQFGFYNKWTTFNPDNFAERFKLGATIGEPLEHGLIQELKNMQVSNNIINRNNPSRNLSNLASARGTTINFSRGDIVGSIQMYSQALQVLFEIFDNNQSLCQLGAVYQQLKVMEEKTDPKHNKPQAEIILDSKDKKKLTYYIELVQNVLTNWVGEILQELSHYCYNLNCDISTLNIDHHYIIERINDRPEPLFMQRLKNNQMENLSYKSIEDGVYLITEGNARDLLAVDIRGLVNHHYESTKNSNTHLPPPRRYFTR